MREDFIINGRQAFDGIIIFCLQFAKTPGPIIATFVLFSVASLIPILKGVPRKGGAAWGGLPQFTPDAEVNNLVF